MFDYYKDNKDSSLGKLIGAMIRRDPVRIAVHEISSAEKGSIPVGFARISLMKDFPESRRKLIDEIKKDTRQIDENEIFFFTISNPISVLPDDTEIEIRRKDLRTPLAEDRSLIFKYIGDYALHDARIYANSSIRKETEQAYRRISHAKK
jgi:hypothetical protein